MTEQRLFREQGKRLRDFRESLDLTQDKFVENIARGRTRYIDWEKGRKLVPDDILKVFQNVYALNPDWYKTGKGPQKIHNLPGHAGVAIEGKLTKDMVAEPPGEEPEPVSESVIDIEYEDAVGKLIVNPVISYMDTDFVKLAVFKRTGAGNEMVGVEYEQIDTVVIPKKLYGAHLIPFKVYGESMEKLIMENSIVLVDTSPHDDIEEGKIYCFRIPYRGFIIRKVEKSLDGLYLIPYNKTFEERRIAWDEFNPEWVIGRVMWNIINPVGF